MTSILSHEFYLRTIALTTSALAFACAITLPLVHANNPKLHSNPCGYLYEEVKVLGGEVGITVLFSKLIFT